MRGALHDQVTPGSAGPVKENHRLPGNKTGQAGAEGGGDLGPEVATPFPRLAQVLGAVAA